MTALDGALGILGEVRKKYGHDAGFLGSEVVRVERPRCSSGSIGLDSALGGGWPMNQWCEIVGNESMGKSVLAAKTIAANQAIDPSWVAVWIDAETSWDTPWMKMIGVDVDRVVVLTMNGMEQVYDVAIRYLESRTIDCLVIDSLPALVPETEDEQEMENFQVGLQARLTNKFFRKQRGAIKRSMTELERPVLGLMINQWRDKVGVIFGDPRTTPGGKQKNFEYVIRVDIRRDDWITDGKVKYGQAMKFVVFKNKSGVPQRESSVDFYFDDLGSFRAGQFDEAKDLLNVAVSRGVIDLGESGMYVYGDRRWRGRPKLVAALREDLDLRDAMRADVLALSRPPLAVKKTVAKKVSAVKKSGTTTATTAKKAVAKAPAKKALATKKAVR